jgi:hypothetical protein
VVCQASDDIALIYFYFEFYDTEKSKLEALVRSFIAQLQAKRTLTAFVLENLFAQCQDGALQPSLRSLSEALSDMLSSFHTVYIVIDALDECKELDETLQFLHDMQGWKAEYLRIIVTSRNLVDIGASICDLSTDIVCVEGLPIQKDISLYISERLRTDQKLAEWPPQSRETISKKIE